MGTASPDNQEGPEGAKSPRKIRIPLWGALFGAFTLFLVVFGLWHWALSIQIDREIARCQAEGRPTSFAELNNFYETPPEEENAALLYEEAAKLLNIDKDFETDREQRDYSSTKWVIIKAWEPWTVEWIDHARACFRKNEAAFALIQKAAKLRQSRYSINFSSPISDNANMSMVSQLITPCLERIKYEAEIRDSRSAIQDIEQAQALIESFRTVPLPWCANDGNTWTLELLTTTERILNRMRLSESELTEVAASIDSIKPDNMDLILPHLRVWAAEPRTMLKGYDIPTWTMAFYESSGLLEMDQIQAFAIIRTRESLSKLPPGLRRKEVDAIQRRLGEVPKGPRGFFILSHSAGGWIQNADNYMDQVAAKIGCLKAAIGVERYRRANGETPPGKLEDLVPRYLASVPVDPFSDKPVLYKATDHDYSVSSVGVSYVTIQISVRLAEPTTMPATQPYNTAQPTTQPDSED